MECLVVEGLQIHYALLASMITRKTTWQSSDANRLKCGQCRWHSRQPARHSLGTLSSTDSSGNRTDMLLFGYTQAAEMSTQVPTVQRDLKQGTGGTATAEWDPRFVPGPRLEGPQQGRLLILLVVNLWSKTTWGSQFPRWRGSKTKTNKASPSRDILVPHTGACYCTSGLHGKHFADVTKVQLLTGGDFRVLSKWAQYNHQDHKVDKVGIQRGSKITIPRALKIERGVMKQGMQVPCGRWKTGMNSLP